MKTSRSFILSIIFLAGSIYTFAQTVPPPYDPAIKLNTIRTWVPWKPLTDAALVKDPARTIEEVKYEVQFIDGMGRVIQHIKKGQSPMIDGTGKFDIIEPSVFNTAGKKELDYISYVAGAQTGNLRLDPFAEQAAFMGTQFPGEQAYYNRTITESSPLNRTLTQLAPGASWAGSSRGVQFQYRLNTAADAVVKWQIADTETSLPVSAGAYPANTLFKNVTINEDGKRTVEFSNSKGLPVLKKEELTGNADGHAGWLCTYFVYDAYDRLRFVISPAAVAQVSSNWSFSGKQLVADELCYYFFYDNENRLVYKKTPGAQPMEFVFDKQDRLVFSRDGNMKAASKWLVNFYDSYNRVTMTGYYASADPRLTLQQNLNTTTGVQVITSQVALSGENDLVVPARVAGLPVYAARNSITFTSDFTSNTGDEFETQLNANLGKTSVSVTVNNAMSSINPALVTPLSYKYYDNYSFPGAATFTTAYNDQLQADATLFPDEFAARTLTNGLLTGSKKRVLMPDGAEQWLTSTTFYDSKGRVIQMHEQNLGGGTDITGNRYNFTGKVLRSFLVHNNPQSSQTPQTRLLTVNDYDHMGRVTAIKKKLNDEVLKTIVATTYDNMEAPRKKVLGNNFQTLTFDYNIRGWLLGANRTYLNNGPSSDRFGYELAYDKTQSIVPGATYTQSYYNGKPAGLTWRSFTNGKQRRYNFTYDAVSRLMKADFTQLDGSAWSNAAVDYSVQAGDGINPDLAYDPNGNIKKLKQRGLRAGSVATVDDLSYKYLHDFSNKLLYVRDVENIPASTMMDFKEPAANNSANLASNLADYDYDLNGNMKLDRNKELVNITYNKNNLAETVDAGAKGKIRYSYDIDGVKLRKLVLDNTVNPAKETITDYMNGFVYENGVLQSIMHEEGRIRAVYRTGEPVKYEYDYFVKDHLNNVRMVLTEQTNFTQYLATMEPEKAPVENALFSNVDNTRSQKPAGYPEDKSRGENGFVSKLNAKQGNQKIGPSIVLKVTAGDTVSLGAKAFFKSEGPQQQRKTAPAEDMIAALASVFSGAMQGDAGKGARSVPADPAQNLDFYRNTYNRLKEKDPGSGVPGRLKAYVNYVLFDNQYNMVDENSGVLQVKNEPDQLQPLEKGQMVIKNSGFLYVYTSNETQQDVYFDNVVLLLAPGPLMEETHYYPHGLTMEGISDKVLSTKYPENKLKFTSQQLDDELGQYIYQFRYRSMDPQTGRFLQLDPLSDKYVYNSPYAYAENKVTLGIDQEGLELLPTNTGWFRMNASWTPSTHYPGAVNWNVGVDLVKGNIPLVFTDGRGTPLFSPASVNVGVTGKLFDPKNGTGILPGHNLPQNPEWAWQQPDPDPANGQAGGKVGDDLDDNRSFADRAGSVASVPQEFHNYWDTYTYRKPIWDAYWGLHQNKNAWYMATAVVNAAWSNNAEKFQYLGMESMSPAMKAAVTNFIYNGTLPAGFNGDLVAYLRSVVPVMAYGIALMDQYGINVDQSLRDAAAGNQRLLQIMTTPTPLTAPAGNTNLNKYPWFNFNATSNAGAGFKPTLINMTNK